eukprot:TRINITY_DN35528_c0_g1_i1.p1 TRINITY_DN35528_c0_g1~~TRINITY_DN35528_c0_g1_i1.p1  ORF type:complete len:712 (-),score=75.35 TRINITY_DN35528_c0_g1_i1:148-2283(-)
MSMPAQTLFCALLVWQCAEGLYFPKVKPNETWQAPRMQPWDPIRATNTSVTVHWAPAWNPWSEVRYYELEARRPFGTPLHFAGMERLQFQELQNENPYFPGDAAWTNWSIVYTGLGRAYTLGIPYGTGHAAQFRVRACGPSLAFEGCSAWSAVQTAHAVLPAYQDKVNFYFRGMGKNAPNYTIIEVDERVIYKRRDETGLVLAVFSRLDFSLHWLRTYDTQRDRAQSVQMSKDIRLFNSSFFVVVVSSIAWEWHAGRTLARTMEYCGAYHFGQWAHVFAEQSHYESPISDLQQVASQDEFGHPYAFIGIPGIGTGHGYESLMYSTGHYLAGASVQVPKAGVRGIAYYDYVARQYRLQDIITTKADFYHKATPPFWETLHNPLPARKTVESNFRLPEMRPYTPYVGTLQNHVTKIIEANGTVPPYNYGFAITTIANVHRLDPRPRKFWVTELERVWLGSSARYWPHNGSQILQGWDIDKRNCSHFVYHGHLFTSPEMCDWEFCDPEANASTVESVMGMIQRTGCPNWQAEFVHPDIMAILQNDTHAALNITYHVCEAVRQNLGTPVQNFMCCGQESGCSYWIEACTKQICMVPKPGAVGLRPDYCCPETDGNHTFLAADCDVGVAPTVCRDFEHVELENATELLSTWAPFPFRVIYPPFAPVPFVPGPNITAAPTPAPPPPPPVIVRPPLWQKYDGSAEGGKKTIDDLFMPP